MRRAWHGDEGAGSVLVVALVAVVVLLAGALAVLARAQVARHEAQSAADLAALAAAGSLWRPPGVDVDPDAWEVPVGCALAREVVDRHAAHLAACEVDDDGAVEVRVDVPTAWGTATARARAGPA